MASKQKLGVPEEEATGSSPKRRGAIGDKGPSKISGREKLGVVQGPSNKLNGEEGSVEKVLDHLGGEEDLQSRNEHPLLNPLILEMVFQYTGTLEEVKRNRLVCRTWMNAAKPQWTTLTKTLTLFRNEQLLQDEGLPSDEDMMTLQQLREMCAGTKSALDKVVLYRKFKFQRWSFDAVLLHTLNTINEPITTDRWFWNRIAPSLIKTLTLEGCHFPVRFMPFEECLLKALPNLESLSVIYCTTTLDILNAAVPVWMRTRNQVAVDQRAHLGYKHQNLKYVHLNVPRRKNQLVQPVSLIPLLGMVPSLEGIRIGGAQRAEQADLFYSFVVYLMANSLSSRLRKLHLLDFSTITYGNGALNRLNNLDGDNYRFQSLQEFHYDLGYGPDAEQEMIFIENNMPVLNKLYLYRAPLWRPLTNFLKFRRIETLTELHLWGNINSSLEFLNAVPNLQVLKWVTCCYEEKFHGYRVTSVLKKSEQLRTYPLMVKDLISTLELVGTLEYLTTLEMDWGPISTASWKRLGEWMPNLKNLKAIVSRAEYVGIMRDQWKQLETLELAHGSKYPGGKLLKELAKFGGVLKTFQWKGCACTRKLFGGSVVSRLKDAEEKLGSLLPEKCTFPWNTNLEGDEANVCKQAVFEETLIAKSVSSMEWSI